MIEKLRKQFIVVAMCSTLAVLAVILGTLNLVSYRTAIGKTDAILVLLSENNGRFPDSVFEKRENFPGREPFWRPEDGFFQDRGKREDGFFKNFTREMPYETRFFFVKINQSGQISMVDTGRVASVETQEAIDYAGAVWNNYLKNHRGRGFINDYRYLITETGSGYLAVFVDAAKEVESARNVLVISLLVSAAGLLAVFVLVVIFSRIVFRPVETGYRKQRQFVTDASHELKTPITVISANIAVLEMESGESEWSRSIKNQIGRMIGLVEQMVTLSRMDEETEGVREQFSLSDAVRETAELFLPVARESKKSLELEIAENISCVGDEGQIRQLISLLLDNAVKYAAVSEEEVAARIRLSLKKRGKRAQLCLWNTADRLEQGNQDILFERFYRPDSSRNSEKGGSGIGLSIAKSIVEAHRGKITAVSRDGKSLEFTAILPIV